MTDNMNNKEGSPQGDIGQESQIQGFQSPRPFELAPAGGSSFGTEPEPVQDNDNIMMAHIGGTRAPRSGGSGSTEFQPGQRRFGGIKGRVAAGVIGALALFGAGGYVAEQQLNNGDDGDKSAAPLVTPEGQKDTTTPIATATERPKPEATATPEVEVPFPYELSYKVEYDLADTKVIFGVEKATSDRPLNNMCKEDAGLNSKEIACPPIKSIELSDEYLRKFAPDLFPNGMPMEEMKQRLNDGIISIHLANLKELATSKDLTMEQLKKMIHEGNPPTYTIPDNRGEHSVTVDPSKPLYIIAIDKSNPFYKLSTGTTMDYKKYKQSLVVGEWNVASFFLKDSNPDAATYNRVASTFTGQMSSSLLAPPIGNIGQGNNLNELKRVSTEPKKYLFPVNELIRNVSIIVIK